MIKNPDSKYACNIRSDFWIKLKPDYDERLCDDIDMLIVSPYDLKFNQDKLGGIYGHGALDGILGSFICGILDQTTPACLQPRFLAVCNVGSGFTMDLRRQI